MKFWKWPVGKKEKIEEIVKPEKDEPSAIAKNIAEVFSNLESSRLEISNISSDEDNAEETISIYRDLILKDRETDFEICIMKASYIFTPYHIAKDVGYYASKPFISGLSCMPMEDQEYIKEKIWNAFYRKNQAASKLRDEEFEKENQAELKKLQSLYK